MTLDELLLALQDELATRFDLACDIRYRRTADVVELTERRVSLQPTSFSYERTGKAEPRHVIVVDLVSEEHVAVDEIESVSAARIDEFEMIARDLVRRPWVDEAFCLAVKTFDDAPAGITPIIIEQGFSLLLSGLQMTFVIG